MLTSPGQRDLAAFNDRLRALGESPRTWELDRLEQLWSGDQYDGRPDWFDQSVPVQERAPCVVHPVVRIAGQRLAAMVFGERRFPRIAAKVGPVGVGALALSPDDAAALAAVLVDIVERADLKTVARGMLCDGLKVGTAVPVAQLRAGQPHVELLPAKWCTPEFDARDPDEVTRLVFQYRRPGDPERDPDEDAKKTYWYRREITAATDTVWDGVEARPDGKQPDWSLVPHRSQRPLEFNPVVWARNLPDSSCHAQLDGVALGAGLEHETEALDLAHSMRHRNALYNGDPVPVVTGAGPEDVDAEKGRQPVGPLARRPDQQTAAFGRPAGAGGPGIKKGPGSILWLRKPDAAASLLESSGAGNKILADDAVALRQLLYEAMAVVVTDPANLPSDLSGRALEFMFGPMVDLCDQLRECWGRVLRRLLSKLLRLCASDLAARDGVFVAGIDAARPILRRFLVAMSDKVTRWVDPPLALTWGPYFAPSPAELLAAAQYLTLANGNQPLMSTAASVKQFAAVANLDDDVAAEADRVQAEQAQRTDDLHAALGALGNDGGADTPPGAQHPAFRAQQEKMKQAAKAPPGSDGPA